MGGSQLVGWDYRGPDVEPEEVQQAVRRRRRLLFSRWPTKLVNILNGKKSPAAPELTKDSEVGSPEPEKVLRPRITSKHVSFDQHILPEGAVSSSQRDGWQSRIGSPAPTTTAVETADVTPPTESRLPSPVPARKQPAHTTFFARTKAVHARLRPFLKNLFMPGSVAILLSLMIALVPQLKALFVEVDSTHIPPAPDGQPPLAFILDAASFIGAASVPMGLICLGSALARLSIPRGAWRTLPTGAILGLAVAKMLITPVLGVLICNGLVDAGVISRDDKVLRFVCIFFSCLPTATTQVFVTQVYSGTGSAEHLSAFLIPQYILMLPAMTALTVYTLHTLF